MDSPAAKIARPFRNHLLMAMAPEDYSFIEPHLELADLPVGRDVEIQGQRADHMFFIESGIVSIVAKNDSGKQIEIGLIGREGVTGLAVILGDDVANHAAYVQVEGHGYKVPAVIMLEAIRRSMGLRDRLARFAHTLMIQIAHTALANGRANLVERLSRWILIGPAIGEGGMGDLDHQRMGKARQPVT